MKQDHEELIEAMVEAVWDEGLERTVDVIAADVKAALRAANERGFYLCKLPNDPEATHKEGES